MHGFTGLSWLVSPGRFPSSIPPGHYRGRAPDIEEVGTTPLLSLCLWLLMRWNVLCRHVIMTVLVDMRGSFRAEMAVEGGMGRGETGE